MEQQLMMPVMKDLVMPMYNLLEYYLLSNYSDTTGNLWFYFKNGAANFNANTVSNNDFKYKTKLIQNTVADGANRWSE